MSPYGLPNQKSTKRSWIDSFGSFPAFSSRSFAISRRRRSAAPSEERAASYRGDSVSSCERRCNRCKSSLFKCRQFKLKWSWYWTALACHMFCSDSMNRSGLIEGILDANTQWISLAHGNLGPRENAVRRDCGDILFVIGIQSCGCDAQYVLWLARSGHI